MGLNIQCEIIYGSVFMAGKNKTNTFIMTQHLCGYKCAPCVHGLDGLVFAMHPSSLQGSFQCHGISQDELNTLFGRDHVCFNNDVGCLWPQSSSLKCDVESSALTDFHWSLRTGPV